MQNPKNVFLINGQTRDNDSCRFVEIDGKTGDQVSEFPNATAQDAADAVDAADKAFRFGWKSMLASDRKLLFARLIAVLESDYGYPRDSLVCQLVDFYRDLLETQYPEILIQNETYTSYAVREPLGVVVVMVPVNSPALTGITGCIPALAAGNTVVLEIPHLKVQEGLDLGHAMHKAGFPAGVINVIASSDDASSREMVEHPKTRMISFTGSSATAKEIMASAARDLKRVHFNLGNKGPALLFDDCDWEHALQAMLPRMFPGQACSAPSRLLVHEPIVDEVIARLTKLAESKGPVPLIDAASVERMESYVEIGQRDGELLFGGTRAVHEDFPNGCWFQPTAFQFTHQSSPVCREEIFGPVLSVLSFRDEAEAISMANDTDFGLIAFAFTRDIKRIQRITRALEFGTVSINDIHLLSPHSPWGGFRQSGVGKHYGKHALDEFSEIKSIQIFNT